MSLYALHPSRLRRGLCERAVAALPDGGEAPPGDLTAGQAARLWPGLAAEVAGHDALCGGMEEGPRAVRAGRVTDISRG